jgi:DNA primase
MNFGDHELFNITDENNEEKNISVAEYVTREILNEELEFKNLMYKQIFEEFLQSLNNHSPIDKKHFINHPDQKIRTLAADVFSSPHTLSKIWERHESYVETPEMRLKEDVPRTIIVYKSKVVEIARMENEKKLKKLQEEKNEEKINELQQQSIILNALRTTLSKELGRIIL